MDETTIQPDPNPTFEYRRNDKQALPLVMLVATLAVSILLSGCATTTGPSNKNSIPAETAQSASSPGVVPAAGSDSTLNGAVTADDDGKYYVGMPDSALGKLSSLEKEIVKFGNFGVLTVSWDNDTESAQVRFDEFHQKQQFNRAVKVFDQEIGFEKSTQYELLTYIDALYNTGAHGKSLLALQGLEGKFHSDFDKIKNGKYETSLWDSNDTRIAWVYSKMLTGYSRYYEMLGDYRHAIHLSQKSLRIVSEFNGMWFARFKLENDITMARLSALSGDREQVAYYFDKIDIYEPPAILAMAGGDLFKRLKLDGKINAHLALRDFAAADALIAERSNTSEEDRKGSGFLWGFSFLVTLLNPIQGIAFIAENAAADASLSHIYESDSYKQSKAIREAFIPSKVAFEMGRYDIASAGYDALLENRVASAQTVIYYTILHDRGRISLHEGDSEAAKNYLVQAIEILESQRSSFNSESSKIGFIGDKQAIYFSLIKLLIENNQLDEALRYVERSKARALVDMLAQKDMSGSSGKAMTQYRQQLSAYNASQLTVDQSDFSVSPEQRALQLKKSKRLTRVLQQAAPDLASLISVDVPSTKMLQTHINKDEALIEYYGYAGELYAFVLTRNSINVQKLDSESMEDTVRRFRQALLNPGDQTYRSAGKQLYQQLIQPLKPYLKTRKLAIVPHGALHYLPFAALTSSTGKFALDEYQIRILPSASVMRFLKARSKNKRYMLALGNPDLNRDDLDLPGAQTEVEKITGTDANIDAFFRKDASETLIKQSSSQYQRLHIASHGVFYADRPMQSSLLLAKDDSNDGHLTVSEIYDLDLNADLVTLSACETGLGKITNGDDVIGLNRGFLYAGANTIISSLWQVSDAATAELMQLFYQNNGNDKREALHSAQLRVKEKYPHPYYWAAFQITGAVN